MPEAGSYLAWKEQHMSEAKVRLLTSPGAISFMKWYGGTRCLVSHVLARVLLLNSQV